MDANYVGRSARYLDMGVLIGNIITTNLDLSDYVVGRQDRPTDGLVSIVEVTLTNNAEGPTEFSADNISLAVAGAAPQSPLAALGIDGAPLPSTYESLASVPGFLAYSAVAPLEGSSIMVAGDGRVPAIVPLSIAVAPPDEVPYSLALPLVPRVRNIGAPNATAPCNYMFDAQVLSLTAQLDGLVENTAVRAGLGERFLVFDIALTNRPAAGRPVECVPMTPNDAQLRLLVNSQASVQTNAADLRQIEPGQTVTTRVYFSVLTGQSELDFITVIGGRLGRWNINLPLVPGEESLAGG